MSIPDHIDADVLISRLAGPLHADDRAAFRRAAEAALALLPCLGEGLAYRTVAGLQRAFFTPPPDGGRVAWDISHERNARTSKLVNKPPLG